MKIIKSAPYFAGLFLNTLFLLLIFSLVFLKPFKVIFGQKIPATDLLFLVITSVWLIFLLLKYSSFQWHKVYWFLAFYLAAIFVSVFISPEKGKSFIKFLGELYLVGLAVLTFNLVKNTESLRKVFLVWLFGAAFVCLIGLISIFLFYFQPDHRLLRFTLYFYGAVPIGNYPRIGATFVSASMYCNYLSISLVFLLIARKNSWINLTLFFVLTSMILINALFTISSGLGAFVLIFGAWLWFLYRERFPKTALISLFCGIFFSIAFFLLNFIALQKYPEAPFGFTLPGFEKTFYPSSRFLVWRASLRTFFENPLFGAGIGQDSCRVLFQNTDGKTSLLTDAHNSYLSIASQTGILGLMALLFLIYFLIREFLPFKGESSEISTIRFGLGLAFISAFIYQGFLGSFEDARHLWVLIGLILAFGASKFNTTNSHINLSKHAK